MLSAIIGVILARVRKVMYFSATANFVGSGVLGAVGVVTLTKVKHRRELLFASLPMLFAVHQFIEGFVWLGLDGILSPTVTHDMGAAFMLYAQGLLPFLLPLSVMLFEPDRKDRRRMLPFVVLGGAYRALYIVGADGVPIADVREGKQHRVHQSGDEQYRGCGLYVIATCGSLFFSKVKADGSLRRGKPDDSAGCDGVQAVRVHLAVVRVRGDRQRDHPRLLLEKQRTPALPLRAFLVNANHNSITVG